MRATHPSLTSGGGKVIHQDAENGVVAVERHHEETNERCVVIVNAGDGQWDAESLYGINVGGPVGTDSAGFVGDFSTARTKPSAGGQTRGTKSAGSSSKTGRS